MFFQEVSFQDHKVKGVQVTFISQVCMSDMLLPTACNYVYNVQCFGWLQWYKYIPSFVNINDLNIYKGTKIVIS
jgi:hypothetical protein